VKGHITTVDSSAPNTRSRPLFQEPWEDEQQNSTRTNIAPCSDPLPNGIGQTISPQPITFSDRQEENTPFQLSQYHNREK
jgi:hypothetical protein